MYSSLITARDIASIELALGRPLDSHTPEDSRAQAAYIDSLFAPDGTLVRALTDREERFIHDEGLRCQFDFHYFLRYVSIQLDTALGGYGPIELWESQRIILDHAAFCEERMWSDYDRQIARRVDPAMIRVSGICLVVLKARQFGGTILIETMLLHRFCFWPHMRLILASEDEPKTQEILREKTLPMFRSLPRFLRPNLNLKARDVGLRSDEMDTTIFLQHAKQEGGIAMGGTTHGGHFTELGNWEKQITDQLQNHVFGSIPFSVNTIVACESRAQGQGNFWHHLAMGALAGGVQAGRFHGVFVPWYVERSKYRLEPPEGWRPKPESLKYAYKVWQTSDSYNGRFVGGVWHGTKVELDAAQLYFYEFMRDTAETRPGGLSAFYGDYPAIPEEAFTSSGLAPFSPLTLERLSNGCKDPIRQFEWMDRGARPAELSINPDDERGIIRIFEKPDRHARYTIGVDTAPGLPNWTRRMLQADDRKKDNCAIEVVRVGLRGEPDVQVAEFLAPIDYVAAAPIVNWLGRRYRGRDPEMCEVIVETGPTSGEALQERLLNEYGYWNLYRKANQATYSYATNFGWIANQRSVFDLWYRTKPHISFAKWVKTAKCKERAGEHGTGTKDHCEFCVLRVKFIARSRYLVDTEMRNCEEDPKKQTAKAEYGVHDDAMRATQLAIYAAHKWESFGEALDADVDAPPAESKPDFQASDLSREEMIEAVNKMMEPEEGGGSWGADGGGSGDAHHEAGRGNVW